MKNALTTILLLTNLTIACAQSIPMDLDPAESRAIWSAEKVTGSHTGGVPLAKGLMLLDAGAFTGGEVTLDMTGIECTDITNESSNAKLVRHLKSADFFAVEQFPTAGFTIREVQALSPAKAGDPNYHVSGDLEIKGTVQTNAFDALFYEKDGHYHLAGELSFDRTVYGIKYGSGSFVDDLGDRAISDTVKLTFKVSTR